MGTVGVHPVIEPEFEAKMKNAGALAPPALTTKSDVLLNTCPVGAPPGIVTSNGFFTSGDPFTSPEYTSLMPPPSDDTQKVTGPTATPHALCSVVSVIGAT